uniref:Uncharacterized protein n=1 Tax=Vitis vinifera TaxID=29760 RepID=F6GY66_VITVI
MLKCVNFFMEAEGKNFL